MKMKNKHILLFIFFLIFFTKPAETDVSSYFKDNTTDTKISIKNINKIELNTNTIRSLSQKIHEHYEKLFKQKMFNGCVLVAINNKIIYENAFGYSDIKRKKCLNTNSVFQLASVSKIFTSIAILKLYEKKLLNIHDEVQKYIPEFPYSFIKIQHLLRHTSGLPNYLHWMPDIGRQDTILSHHSVLNLLVQKKPHPEFKAGRKYKYCNTNYALLACLVEKISGMNYSDFLKKEIFIPCNMPNTNTIYFVDVFDENTASSLEYKSRNIPFYAGDFILGDKSIYSNIHDLFNFSQCLLNNKILNDTMMHIMTSGVNTKKYGILYGCGIRIKDVQDSSKTIWFHNGWWHGYRTSFQIRPKDKVTVIVLSNQIYKTTYYTYPVFQTIDEILYQENSTEPNRNDEKHLYPTLDDE